MKLSIILTVYNKEPYLDRAFRSLLNQQDVEEQDYEILAVNDGSTDCSANILEEYAKRDERVRVITQSNQGLSMARNNGMEYACGEYIWFVDADDAISGNAVNSICDAMKSGPDVIPIYAQTEGLKQVRNYVNPLSTCGRDVIIEGRWEHCGVFWIYKRHFLLKNNLFFYPGIYHEDAEFTPRMLYLAESVHVIPEVLYTVFRGDDNSITQVPRPKRAYDMVTVVDRLMSFFIQHGERGTAIWKKMCVNNAGILNAALYVMSCNNKEEQHHFNKCLSEKRAVLRSYWESSTKKYLIEGILFSLCLRQYVGAFSLFRRFVMK